MPSYSAHWNQLRRWNRYGIAILIVNLLFLFFGRSWLAEHVSWAAYPLVMLGLQVGAWLLFFHFVTRQQYFLCPRCGERFFWRGWMEYAVAFAAAARIAR